MNKTQKRVIKVLERLIEEVKNDADFASFFSDDLENVLTEIHSNDGFGTEGQCDPRGDFRNGNWSMTHVEGIDKGIK